MKAFDRYLQNVQVSKAKKLIKKNNFVFEIGGEDGEMFNNYL